MSGAPNPGRPERGEGALFSASGLRLSFGRQELLADASLALYPDEKVGLVGRNGSGKSSFLRIVAREERPDDGTLAFAREISIGYLPQDFALRDEATVLDNVRDGVADVLAVLARYETAEGVSAGELDRLQREIEHRDGWNLETRIESAMRALDVPDGDRPAGGLSGGEKRRVALCRALVGQPDLLVLDEPTNHLDAESVEWLEGFLAGFPGACLFVTHDRYFLDRIATRIVELAGGRFLSHDGSYRDYLEAKAARQAREEAVEGRRQRFLAREVEWVRAGIKARGTKQRSRLDQYHDVKAQRAPDRELDMDLIIPAPPPLGNRIVDLEGVGIRIGGHRLFSRLDLGFAAGTCTGIVGRNGTGKTTLLRILMGELPPDEGSVRIGQRTAFNYVDQARVQIDDARSVLEEVAGGRDFVAFGDRQLPARSYLQRFLFTEERIHEPIGNLSGGEKSRVLLAKILGRGGNFLVLDEPTNDLDLPTLRVLEEAVLHFDGCVVVVSHDRFFLDRLCDRIVAFEGEGRVVVEEGNWSRYLERRRSREAAEAAWNRAASKAPGSGTSRAPKPGPGRREAATAAIRKLKWKEERELEGIEERILAAEASVAELEATLNDPDFYRDHAGAAAGLHEELESRRSAVDALYARWEELEQIRRGEATA